MTLIIYMTPLTSYISRPKINNNDKKIMNTVLTQLSIILFNFFTLK